MFPDEEERQRAIEELAPQIMAMAKGPLVGAKRFQAGHAILAFRCECGAKFGSSGHEARVVSCPYCHGLFNVTIQE